MTVRLLKNQDDVGAAIQPKGAEFTMRPNNIRPGMRIAFPRARVCRSGCLAALVGLTHRPPSKERCQLSSSSLVVAGHDTGLAASASV